MRFTIRAKLVLLLLAVLLTAITLISYREISFFRKDKETYIYDLISQVVTVQAKELERKITSMQGLMMIFSDGFSWILAVMVMAWFTRPVSDTKP